MQILSSQRNIISHWTNLEEENYPNQDDTQIMDQNEQDSRSERGGGGVGESTGVLYHVTHPQMPVKTLPSRNFVIMKKNVPETKVRNKISGTTFCHLYSFNVIINIKDCSEIS